MKMDTIVPSPNMMNTPFTASPHSFSIYDQEKPNTFWGDSKFNVDMSGLTEEGGLLDDNLEDSSLKSILTPELLSSMASSSSGLTSTYQWQNKYNPEESQGPSTESPFIQLGMDSDLLISDLLNIDSDDSKFSAFDFEFKSMPSSSCHTPVPLDSKPDRGEMYTARDSFVPINKEVPSKDSIEAEFLQKKVPIKPNFPPRKSQPPIGVVSPVKILEENKRFELPTNTKSGYEELKVPVSNTCFSSVDMTELPPQTVPSFGVSAEETIKMEPTSPEMSRKKGPVKRPSYDFWDDDSDSDYPSDTESKRNRYDDDFAEMKPGECESLIAIGKKQKQFFWQYNVQSKGPKGTRLKLAVETPADPHVLNGFEDPVFDEGNTIMAGIRHGGKARKGDGNEVTPNPKKLFKIGHQLLRLNKKINSFQLGSDVPLAKKNESHKEKNKLSSRACRLKKKAQHEANKIKLHGLENEHGQINNVLRLIWPELRERAKCLMNQQVSDEKHSFDVSLTSKLTDYISSNLKSMVAGNTTEYVNNVILGVESGDWSGGLNIKPRKT